MKTVKHYFIHNAKERKSTLWIILLACLVSSVPFIYGLIAHKNITGTTFHDELAAIEMQAPVADSNETANAPYQNPENQNYYSSYNSVRGSGKKGNYRAEKEDLEAALFSFDPNTINKEQWIKLGLKPSAANRVMNYIGAGARFYKPEDIRRIWGLSKPLQDRLIPYVKINSQPANTRTKEFNTDYQPKKAREYSIVELNTADTAALIALPGIGEKLSQRIIDYRAKVGGFNNVDQVREVWGIHDSVYQKFRPYIRVNADAIQKININMASLDQLKAHPYIRYKLANVIVNYRSQHGPYKNTEDLKKIVILDDENLNKILPYISFQ